MSLILKVRLIFLIFVLYFFCNTGFANYLSLTDEMVLCGDKPCNFDVYNNYNIKIGKDSRVLELFEKDDINKLIGYLFYTVDVVNIPAYSGYPLEILMLLSSNHILIDLKLVKHSEPILLAGIPIEKLLEAMCLYKGADINKISVGEDVPIIAGATVTSLILHETILKSCRVVLSIGEEVYQRKKIPDTFKKYSWDELVHNKAIKHYVLDLSSNTRDYDLIDIYFTNLLPPSIGKNLLGEQGYLSLFNNKFEKSAILIVGAGTWCFKGSGFIRSGIFDRFRVEQDGNIFVFKESEYVYQFDLITSIDYEDAGVFFINDVKYDPCKPWNLVLLAGYKTFSVKYDMPSIFCKTCVWCSQWKDKWLNIIFLSALWILVILVFIFRTFLSKRRFLLDIIYSFVLLMDVYIIGFLCSPPSVVNVFTLLTDLKTFLFGPYLFISWVMIFLTVILWGKGVFCGWICPFGAVQEIFFRVKSVFLSDTSLDFSYRVISKLKYLKYLIFVFLLFAFFHEVVYSAETWAEVEPFKTTWSVGIFSRGWFSVYACLLLLISIAVVE